MTSRNLTPLLAALILAPLASPHASARQQEATRPPAAPSSESELINHPPPLEQVSPYLDFGYHKPLSFEQGVITLVNNGDKPIKILKTRGECACTVATANKEIVQPGEGVELLVGLELPLELGAVSKQVIVEVEGYKFPFITEVSGESGYAVRVNGGGVSNIVVDLVGQLTLEAIDGRPFRVLALNGQPPVLKDFDPEKDRPRTQYVLLHDFSNIAPINLPRWIIIETDHPDARMVDVIAMIPGTIRLTGTEPWQPVKDHLVLGAIPMDEPSITIMVMTGKPLTPGQKLTSRSRSFDARVDIVNAYKPTTGAGIQIELKITPRGSFQGFLNAVCDLDLDGNKTALEIFARVMPKDQIPIDPKPRE